MTKTALITGITGQDGSYLTELLLNKGYLVHGLRRRSSQDITDNIKHLLGNNKLNLHYGDLTDASSLFNILKMTRPDEVYNLAAQSHVRISFDTPIDTGDITGLGPARILEAMRQLNMFDHSKFYQASTSELYGLAQETPQTETTAFYPRSPYGIAKLYAYWFVKNYREAYDAFACNGILFNHESPRRGINFVTRKITTAVAAIHKGEQEFVSLGNIDSHRDWGHAKDYVEGMWLMLQEDKPDDYVLATGEKHTVREFIEIAFKYIDVDIEWEGKTEKEIGKDSKTGTIRVKIDPHFYRPTEVDLLLGNPIKAEKELKWKRKFSFDDLVKDMMEYDLNLMTNNT